MNVLAKTKTAGFTLIELLVATSISSLLLGVLLMAFNSSSEAVITQSDTLGGLREGRSVIQFISEDIQGLVREPGLSAFAIEQPSGSRSSVVQFASWKGRDALLADGEGDLAMIRYYVDVKADPRSTMGDTSARIYRAQIQGDAAITALESLYTGNPLFGVDDTNAVDDLVPADTTIDSALGFDVLEFKVVPYVRDIDASGASPVSRLVETPDQEWHGPGLPAVLDVTVRVATESLSVRLDAKADWEGTGAFSDRTNSGASDLDDREMHSFHTRIYFDDRYTP